MLEIADGAVRAYYLFDVADTIDLRALTALGTQSPAAVAYLHFAVPPITASLGDADIAGMGCSVRLKLYDYGVMSLRLTFPANGSWNAFAAIANRLRTDEAASRFAEATVLRIRDEYAHAFDEPHDPLIEDYFALEIGRFREEIDAQTLLAEHRIEIANVLAGEQKRLSNSETEETLRTRFSYHEDDLTIVQWDTAFVYDRADSARAIQDILEFANSQLLELRTYDALLDRELDAIYKLQPGRPSRSLRGSREAERAATLRYLIVDVLELMDRSSNALKVVGDAYYARIYRSAAARLGLGDWQRQIDAKLASVGDMYRFFSDQARSSRDEFLEIIIIVLIALELLVGLATLFHR
jgi:hypothetical protein